MSQISENKAIVAPVPITPLQEFWRYFKHNRGAVIGLVYVVVVPSPVHTSEPTR